jgi:hypothetical protein
MTANRFYSNSAVETTLSSSIGSGTTSITVGSVSGFPSSYPYTLEIDPEGTMELVSVTAGAGTTLTVTRGEDNTSALSHDSGVVVRHAASAQDFREPQEHIGDSTDVHGLAGGAAVVGTSSTQTLTNKTLTSPTITTPTISSTGFTSATHAHSAASSGGTIAHSALTGLTSGDPHTQYQKESEKASASGYASLDSSTKVPIAQVPTGTSGSTVALGNHTHNFGGLVARTSDAGYTIAAGSSTVETGDFATTAGVAYEMKYAADYLDPDSAANFTATYTFEYSTDSGGSWDQIQDTLDSDAGLHQYISSGGSSLRTAVSMGTVFVPGAQGTLRVRVSANRSAGTITADVGEGVLTVVRIGADET